MWGLKQGHRWQVAGGTADVFFEWKITLISFRHSGKGSLAEESRLHTHIYRNSLRRRRRFWRRGERAQPMAPRVCHIGDGHDMMD
jgi:hypothetical protein